MRRIHLSYATAFAILLIVTAVASPRNLAAHNDQLGTINLLRMPGAPGAQPEWRMSVNLATDAMASAMSQRFGRTIKFGQPQFEAYAFAYLRETIRIVPEFESAPAHPAAHDRPTVLADPTAQLNGHHSSFYFTVRDIPESAAALRITITAGRENQNHHNLLFIKMDPEQSQKDKYSLEPSNDYTVHARISTRTTDAIGWDVPLTVLVIVGALAGGYALYRGRRRAPS